MPTIQVRDVPEETYRLIRLRASAEGKSLQAFMRDLLIETARRRTKAEAIAAIERRLARTGGAGLTPDEIVAEIRQIRGE